MLDRIRAFIRRCRHRPTFFQEQIAKRTGETTIAIAERHREAARCSPYTVLMIEEIDLIRVIGRPGMGLIEAMDLAAASECEPGQRPDIVKAVHGRD